MLRQTRFLERSLQFNNCEDTCAKRAEWRRTPTVVTETHSFAEEECADVCLLVNKTSVEAICGVIDKGLEAKDDSYEELRGETVI